jgi:hypothetical protein
MFYWGYWIGPLIAVFLALWLRPTYLAILGLVAIPAFLITFSTSFRLYDECGPCSTRAETLFSINGILFTVWPALLLLALAKHVLNHWLDRRSAPESTAV